MKVARSYPHVEEARAIARTTGDNTMVRFFGHYGGIRSGEIRRAEAQRRRQIEAIESGTIVPKKKKRPTISLKRLQAITEWVGDPSNYVDECRLRDEEANLHICPID